ncbi:DUF3145 family protein [Gordonia aichiensis]|uniref:DUF3145 family protein n=1 Tax=Gordonia aichiensis TaxID=36820 RepID=UPI003264E3D5
MGDRTPLQLQIVACPTAQAAAVLEIIDAYNLVLDADGDGDHGVLRLGEKYVDAEARCGSAEEVASRLHEAAPDASWECWEDPKYEWLGNLYQFTPELGLFTAECDGEGQPRFTASEVRQFTNMAAAGQDVDLARALGELHAQFLAKKIEQAKTGDRDRIAVPAED